MWAVAVRHAADHHLAEDAFQATFLTLARVAGRLDPGRPLAGWLHTVTLRFARKTRRFGRRHRVTTPPETGSPRTPLDELTGRELLAAIDVEVRRLPDRYRLPVILCYLQGMTRDEAAAQLGWPAGVLKGRLERARHRLHRRLTARGLTLPAILAGPLLAPALVPSDLRAGTVELAQRFATGPITSPVAMLAERAASRFGQMPRTWFVTAVALAAGLTVGLTVADLGGLDHPPTPAPPPREVVPAREPELARRILPDGAIRTFGDQRFRHPGGISGSALSPDGKRLATAASFSVMMWDTATGEPIWRADGGEGGHYSAQPLIFSPDGSKLVLVRTICACVWDTATGRELRRIRDPRVKDEWISGATFDATAAFTLDGNQLALGRIERLPKGVRQTTEFYDTSTWTVARCEPGIALAFHSPAGPTVIGLDSERFVVFSEPATGRPTTRLKTQVLASQLILSPDGKALAVLKRTGDVEILAVPSGELIRSFPGAAPKDPIAPKGLFAADGKTLLVTRPTGIGRLEIATGKELDPIPVRGLPSLHILPDKDTLLTCADDGLVRRWSLATLKETTTTDGYSNWTHSAVSADGSRLAVGEADGRLDLWDLSTGERAMMIRESTKQVMALAFSPDGKTLAVGRSGVGVEIRDLPIGRLRTTFAVASDRGPDHRYVDQIHFNPDGWTLVAGSGNGRLESWDLAIGKPIWTGATVEKSAISPNGKVIVSALPGPNLAVSDPATGAIRQRIKLTGKLNERMGGEIPSLVFTPDGRRLLVATRDQHVRILDPVTFDERGSFATSEMRSTGFGPMRTGAEAMAVSPDGRWLLTGGEGRTVRVWELSTRTEVRRFPGHDSQVRMVAFGPGGRTVLSAGTDGAIYQWEPRPITPAKVEPSTWADLGADDPLTAYRAVWALADEPTAAVELLRTNLSAAKAPTAERLAKLIEQLGADRFADREVASRELTALGRLAEPTLKAAVGGKISSEARERADRILAAFAGESVGEELRQSRAVQALELAGTAEARALLKEWAAGAPGSRLTEEAAAAMNRLERK